MALRSVPDHLKRVIRAYRQPPPFRGHVVAALTLPFRFHGIAVSENNEVFLTHHFYDGVTVYSPSGTLLHKWGPMSGGRGAGELHSPRGIAVAKTGEVVVADCYNHRVQVFRTDGTFVRMWGSEGEGKGQFKYPTDVAVTAGGEVIVVDGHDHIQVFRLADGAFLRQWATGRPVETSFQDMFVSVTPSNQVCVARERGSISLVFRW